MKSNINQSFLLKNQCLSKKFINHLTINGKKLKASSIFYKMLNNIKKKIAHYGTVKKVIFQQKNIKYNENNKINKIFYKAINNIKPSLDVRKVRIAGTTYNVPAILSKKKQENLAIKWLLLSAKNKKKKYKNDLSDCLAHEILDAYKHQGQSLLKRDELHKTAETNRAYIRYRWW